MFFVCLHSIEFNSNSTIFLLFLYVFWCIQTYARGACSYKRRSFQRSLRTVSTHRYYFFFLDKQTFSVFVVMFVEMNFAHSTSLFFCEPHFQFTLIDSLFRECKLIRKCLKSANAKTIKTIMQNKKKK